MPDYGFLQSCKHLEPPCSSTVLESIEADLNYPLPAEYRDFLLYADGGMPTEAVILFSAGRGIHPDETLRAANEGRQDLPVVFIGRFAEEEFGFLRDDTGESQRPVYVYEHESGRTRKLAASFEAFLRTVLSGKTL